MWPLSATTRHAERRMISATTIDSSGSIGIQPVARITSAAMTAATEPSRSPMTCSTAARMLRLSLSPERRTKKARTLTPRPAAAIHSMGAPSTATGALRRCTASTTIQAAIANRAMPLTNATSTAKRSKP